MADKNATGKSIEEQQKDLKEAVEKDLKPKKSLKRGED